jgi:hypothetical protein
LSTNHLCSCSSKSAVNFSSTAIEDEYAAIVRFRAVLRHPPIVQAYLHRESTCKAP